MKTSILPTLIDNKLPVGFAVTLSLSSTTSTHFNLTIWSNTGVQHKFMPFWSKSDGPISVELTPIRSTEFGDFGIILERALGCKLKHHRPLGLCQDYIVVQG